MREIDLPSGAKLKITLASYSVSKELLVSILDEVKGLRLNPDDELDINILKDIFCVGFSSKKIQKSLDECMKRALYNNLHIDDKTFEPEEARQDYFVVCFEVVKENVMPFTKALMQQYSAILEALKRSLA